MTFITISAKYGVSCTRNQKRRLSIPTSAVSRLRDRRAAPRLALDHRHLAEHAARAERLEHAPVDRERDAPARDDVHPVGRVALAEDRRARRELLALAAPLEQPDVPLLDLGLRHRQARLEPPARRRESIW